MSEPTWDFEKPEMIGAVPKFISDVRAALADGNGNDPEATIVCVRDALTAFDEAMKAVQESTHGG